MINVYYHFMRFIVKKTGMFTSFSYIYFVFISSSSCASQTPTWRRMEEILRESVRVVGSRAYCTDIK